MKTAGIKHYTKALIAVGKQQGVFDQLILDLTDVSVKLNENLDFKQYLNNSHVKIESKVKALDTVFQDFISARTKNFVLLLVKNKKLNYLDQIIALAQKGHLQDEDISEVVVESIIPLTATQEKKLEQVLVKKLGRKVLLRNLINDTMLGGLILKVGDKVIDASIRGKIQNLKKKINTIEY